MRIGIDGRRLGIRPKGIGRYIWELCRGLDEILPEARFFLYTPRSLNLAPISNRWSLRVDQSPFGRLPNNLWLAVQAGRLARSDELDCFWSGSGLLPLVRPKARTVLTIHDLVHKVAPRTMDTRALWATRVLFRMSIANADALVSNSEGTARRLEKCCGYKVTAVVRPGVSRCFRPQSDREVEQILARIRISRPYFLAVGTWEPRKGLQLLVQTFLNMRAQGLVSNHRLALVGERGWKDADVADLVRRNFDCVSGLGFVDDETLAGLYRGSEAFVFPSIYEGFGMPVLEARACGARVITTDLPELREAGGNGGIYIEPTEVGIRGGMLSALDSRPADEIDLREWSWSKSAAILAQVLLGRAPSEGYPAHRHEALGLSR
jgi:glycosyltransferase involved in cell wall biosynthesis